ncbi:MAG TPA: thioesterase family protein [Thermoleophilaceae bacterium]|nr:thioesterase family protein [Thermoleophilaceae bacterium]
MALPTVNQVRQLPQLSGVVVPPEYEDFNGHMRITHHLGVHDDASMPFFALIGIDASYFAARRLGVVDLEHHIQYVSEVFVGDRVAVHARFLSRSDNVLHSQWFLLNVSRERIANTLEAVSLHLDLDGRRAAPFPADVAGSLDRVIEEHQALDWDAPTCGFMGPRSAA